MKVARLEDLFVCRCAHGVAMEVFEQSRTWPPGERYALSSQVLRSSRSVCANLAEAWAKRRYRAHFVSKLTDAHAEAQETLTWLSFARDCGYLSAEDSDRLNASCHRVIGGIVSMIRHAPSWDPTTSRSHPPAGNVVAPSNGPDGTEAR